MIVLLLFLVSCVAFCVFFFFSRCFRCLILSNSSLVKCVCACISQVPFNFFFAFGPKCSVFFFCAWFPIHHVFAFHFVCVFVNAICALFFLSLQFGYIHTHIFSPTAGIYMQTQKPYARIETNPILSCALLIK